MVHLIARAVENVAPLNDLATRAAELRGAARRAVDRLTEKSNNAVHGALDAKPRAVTISARAQPPSPRELRRHDPGRQRGGDCHHQRPVQHSEHLQHAPHRSPHPDGTSPRHPPLSDLPRASARSLTDLSARSLTPPRRARAFRLLPQWFPNPPRQLAYPLATLCDPYLNLFRGIIPPIGGTIDLSPILAFTVLNVFTNTAAALPCEIGEDGEPIVTERRGKWAKRLAAAAKRRAEQNATKVA